MNAGNEFNPRLWFHPTISVSDMRLYAIAYQAVLNRHKAMLGQEQTPSQPEPVVLSLSPEQKETFVTSASTNNKMGRPRAVLESDSVSLLNRIEELRRSNPEITLKVIAKIVGVNLRTLRRTLERLNALPGREK